MGDEDVMLRKIRVGQLHAGGFGGPGASRVFNDLLALEMPFLFNDYEEIDHSDRDEFDGRKSRVVGVDSDIKKQRKLKENYKAVSAQPLFNTWGNRYNQILNEESKVNGAKSLMERMKKVIK